MITVVLLLALAVHGVASGTCFQGWVEFKGYCYSFNEESLSWFDAGASCLYYGAYLVQVDSQVKSDWLNSVIAQRKLRDVWVGGTSRLHKGTWEWLPSKKSFANFQNWDQGEPNGLNDEHCVEINRDGKWNDITCTDNNNFICERKAAE